MNKFEPLHLFCVGFVAIRKKYRIFAFVRIYVLVLFHNRWHQGFYSNNTQFYISTEKERNIKETDIRKHLLVRFVSATSSKQIKCPVLSLLTKGHDY